MKIARPSSAGLVLALALISQLCACSASGGSVPGSTRGEDTLGLHDVSGTRVRLEDFRGAPVLLHFWATWCKSCGQEMESLQNLHRNLGAKGLQIVSIAVDSDLREVRAFQQSRRIDFPVLMDSEGKAKALYDVRGVPHTFLLDRDGKQQPLGDPLDPSLKLPSIIGPRDWDDPLASVIFAKLLEG